jgi:hypothetical protein
MGRAHLAHDPSARFAGTSPRKSEGRRRVSQVPRARQVQIPFSCFRLQILWVGLCGHNDVTGNPFRRGGVPMTAASIPGVAAENGGLAMNDPKERNPQQSQQERDQQQRERQQREQQQRQNQQPNQKPGQPGNKPGQPQHRDE